MKDIVRKATTEQRAMGESETKGCREKERGESGDRGGERGRDNSDGPKN